MFRPDIATILNYCPSNIPNLPEQFYTIQKYLIYLKDNIKNYDLVSSKADNRNGLVYWNCHPMLKKLTLFLLIKFSKYLKTL